MRAVLFAAVVAVGVRLAPPAPAALTSPPPVRNEALIVPADATNVFDAADYDGLVSYELPEPFPPSALATIKQTLEQRGWRPLTDDLWNPGLPSSHARGWTSAREAGATLKAWSAEWENERGDVVSYAFVYRIPEDSGTPSATPAKVVAIFMKAATARQVRAARAIGVG